MDYGHEQTDKELKTLENRIRKEYGKAVKEAEQKLRDYLKAFDAQDKKMAERLKTGEITKDEYLKWRKAQMATGEKWQSLRDSLVDTYQNANREVSRMIQDNAYKAYADNFNFGTFEVEKGSNVDTAFTLYSQDSVRELVKSNKDILPPPGAKLSQAIREGKAKRWNRQQVQSVMLQGILLGESIPKIAKRLSREVGEKNMHSAIRSARTMTTEAENAGRVDSYKRAQDMGIEVRKQWLATLDGRTRHSHRMMDGESVPIDAKFSNGLAFPADPDGSPSEVYNCRCTLIADIPEYSNDLSDLSQRRTGKGFTGDYEEWKHEHEKREKSGIVNGTDISGTWTRRAGEFDFEIEDVINAQGFDGLPRVVDEEEFDRLVQEANNGQGFIAQRTYSATSQDVLDNYRDELYNGHWYVDCSTGGAQYGQGMYCAADFTDKITNGIKNEMVHYQRLGIDRLGGFTDDDISYIVQAQKRDADEILRKYKAGEIDRERGVALYKDIKAMEPSEYLATHGKHLEVDGPRSYTETFTLDKSARIIDYDDLVEMQRRDEITSGKRWMDMDIGSYAVLKGYDAINAGGHGESGSYVVILNRTKIIFKKG